MDPKRPTSPLQTAARGAGAARSSPVRASDAESRMASLDDEFETPPAKASSPARVRPDLTLIKTEPAKSTALSPTALSPTALSPDMVTAPPVVPPGADAETVMVLERLKALCPALEFPFGAQRFDAEAFFALPETPDDSRRYELIDGVVVVSPSVLPIHSHFTLNLLVSLFLVIRDRGMGAIFSEVDVTPDPHNVLRPDLMWYGDLPTDDETLARRIVGIIPWIVLETLSERTKKYDQVEKRNKYEQMGVKEYWILHPKKKWLEVHHFASGRVTRLKHPTDLLSTDLLVGWSLSMAALFDPAFNPTTEQNKELLAEFEEKRQALRDALEDEQVRRAGAEAIALEESQKRTEAEAKATDALTREAQAHVVATDALTREAQAHATATEALTRQLQLIGIAEEATTIAKEALERQVQADAAAAEARERQVQAESIAREEVLRAAQLEAEKNLALKKLAASQDQISAFQDQLAASQDQFGAFQDQLAAAAAREAELLAQIERLQHPER